MASRLTVIISQSALRHSRVADAEETLLTELMLTAGLDATLIGPLESVRTDSTDYLCLSGLTQSIALVASLSTPEVAAHWQRLQLHGQVVQFGQARGLSERRIYHLPLELGTQRILEQLRQLLNDKAVHTVSLALPLAVRPAQRPVTPLPQPAKEPVDSGGNGSHALPRTAESGSGQISVPEMQWPDLDRLVDDFDLLDL